MRWRAVKRIPIYEVRNRIKTIEAKYGERFQELHEAFIKGHLAPDEFQDYVDWSGMNHALRAAGEGEDFDYYADEELQTQRWHMEQLTPSRLNLLDYIADVHVSSINELAAQLHRDVKNVYTDLKLLEKMGFIRLVPEGRSLVPELLIQELTVQLG